MSVRQIIDRALASLDSYDREKVAQEARAAEPKTEVAIHLRKVAESLRSYNPNKLTLADVDAYLERVRAL